MSVHGDYSFNYISLAQAENQIKARAAKEGGGSWLMALAMLMGDIADKMMVQTFRLADALDNVQDQKAAHANSLNPFKKDPGSLSENRITAELQAQTQLMNMFMQAMTTVIKSVGEGNTQAARKQ